ncbi:hypothetical protein HanLR1_Chr16g0635061 [Helianthus annuus]|nr:hypothetical protein HanLR1_Chr16g0635061 [Helianthus annuus]
MRIMGYWIKGAGLTGLVAVQDMKALFRIIVDDPLGRRVSICVVCIC